MRAHIASAARLQQRRQQHQRFSQADPAFHPVSTHPPKKMPVSAGATTSNARLRHLAGVLSHEPASAAAADDTDAGALVARLAALQREQDAIQLELGRLTAVAHSKNNVFVPPTGLESLEEIAAFFRTNGFWCVPDAVSGEWLDRVQASFREGQAKARALWEAAKLQREQLEYEPGNTGTGMRDAGSEHHDLGEPVLGEALAGRHANGYFDVPRFVEQDESLLRLLDNPNTLPIIEAVMGGLVQVNQIQARTVPAEVASEYTSWHRDAGDQIAIDPNHSPTLKAFTFFFDVPEFGGCAAVLPGSHRVQFACNPHWGHGMDQETMGADGMPNNAEPTFVKFPCKAGTVVMYDNRIFHNALPNTSGVDRCALITSYQPYGRSQSGQVVGNAERLLKAGKLDGEDKAKLRQLIGWRLGIGPDGYDQPGHHLLHPTPDNR